MKTTIIIPGPIPSKKNSRVGLNIKGRLLNVPNGAFRKWHRMAGKFVAAQNPNPVNVTCDRIEINFFMAENRARDLTNVTESIMDLLVDLKILPDDSWQHTGTISLIPCGIDRQNPRAEVNIFI